MEGETAPPGLRRLGSASDHRQNTIKNNDLMKPQNSGPWHLPKNAFTVGSPGPPTAAHARNRNSPRHGKKKAKKTPHDRNPDVGKPASAGRQLRPGLTLDGLAVGELEDGAPRQRRVSLQNTEAILAGISPKTKKTAHASPVGISQAQQAPLFLSCWHNVQKEAKTARSSRPTPRKTTLPTHRHKRSNREGTVRKETADRRRETGKRPTFFLVTLNGRRFPEGSEITSTSLSLQSTSNDLWQQGTAATMSYDWRASLPAVCGFAKTRVER